MIYLTVGSHFKPFDRLIRAVDEIAGKHRLDVVAQIGPSKVQVKNLKCHSFLSYNDAKNYIMLADVVITHGGFGTLLLANKYSKKTIIVPRYKKFDEHMDDHQVEICDMFLKERKKNYYIVKDIQQLESTLLSCLENISANSENNGRQNILVAIKEFLKSN